jgi:HEAT repeat protein
LIQDIIYKLAEGNTPSAVQVSRLAELSSDDLRDFRGRWQTLPVDRRLAVLTLASQLAENDVHLDFSPVLKMCLSDSDGAVRAAAIDGLWEDEEFRTGDLLARILRTDPDERARAAAAVSLARFALLAEVGTLYRPTANRVRVALLDTIHDPREVREVRRRAIEAVGAFSDPEIAELIEQTYADPDPKLRASALYAMGRNADERWWPTVLRELDNENDELRFEAARAAGEIGSTRAIVPLITLLDDPDLEVRLAAIGSLGEIGGDVARKALDRCLRSENAAIRSAAEEAIAEIEIEVDPLSTAPFLKKNTPTI